MKTSLYDVNKCICFTGHIYSPVRCFLPTIAYGLEMLSQSNNLYGNDKHCVGALLNFPSGGSSFERPWLCSHRAKVGRCLNTAVTFCTMVCYESFISISIDGEFGPRQKAGQMCLMMANADELFILTWTDAFTIKSLSRTKLTQLNCQYHFGGRIISLNASY